MFLGTGSAISSPDDTIGAVHRANTFHGPPSTGSKLCTVSELAFKHYGEAGGREALNIFRVVPWVRRWRSRSDLQTVSLF